MVYLLHRQASRTLNLLSKVKMTVNHSLPCITVKYSNSTYKASHKRNSDKTYRKSTPTDFELTEFDNAKQAAQNLLDSWDIRGGDNGWGIVSAGHCSDSWYFIAQCV